MITATEKSDYWKKSAGASDGSCSKEATETALTEVSKQLERRKKRSP